MIVDTYAWIELLKASEKGKIVGDLLLRGKCYTAITTIAEIVDWCLRVNVSTDYVISRINLLSTILGIDKKIAMLAGEINFRRKKKIKDWGMMDSFILALALSKKIKILTGDKHFSDLPNVKMI